MQQGLKTTLLELWGIRVKAVKKKKKKVKAAGGEVAGDSTWETEDTVDYVPSPRTQ